MNKNREIEKLQQLQSENLIYAIRSMPKAFSNPEKAARARNYVKRQALQSMHRAIELSRGGIK